MGNTHNTSSAVAWQIICFRHGASIGLEEIRSHGEANRPIQVTEISLFEITYTGSSSK